MRKNIVAGNWKMNLTLTDGEALTQEICSKLKQEESEKVEVILCSPFIHLSAITKIAKNNRIKVGAQNCSSEEAGAYTGETSAKMIKSAGAEYVILGHSERRAYFNEDAEILTKKVGCALNNKLKVIFCCGEALEDRENGNYFDLVREQLERGLFSLSEKEFENIVLAYEPVWAIGTGVTASSDQAQEMHNFIRTLVTKRYGESVADKTTILYGGSCNAKNAKELFSMKDVDGGLIGGASLKSDDFNVIINSF